MFIEIDGWRSNLRFSACHFIPEYSGAPRVHGYTYTINIRVHGTPNETGIIIDFERIKIVLSSILERFDHKVIVPSSTIRREDDTNIYCKVTEKLYSIPKAEVAVVDLQIPSAEELSRMMLEELIKDLEIPENVIKIEFGLDESWGAGAWSEWMRGEK